jgi:predicted SprT family Zn-dependent metalloprotease
MRKGGRHSDPIGRCWATGKRSYLTMAAARRNAKRERKHVGKLFAYRCGACEYYHLTSRRLSPEARATREAQLEELRELRFGGGVGR